MNGIKFAFVLCGAASIACIQAQALASGGGSTRPQNLNVPQQKSGGNDTRGHDGGGKNDKDDHKPCRKGGGKDRDRGGKPGGGGHSFLDADPVPSQAGGFDSYFAARWDDNIDGGAAGYFHRASFLEDDDGGGSGGGKGGGGGYGGGSGGGKDGGGGGHHGGDPDCPPPQSASP